jgi:hypothetical protein
MRELVDLATSQPPPARYTPDDIVAAGQRAERHRRGWTVAGSAAATVLAVIAAVTVPSLVASNPSAPSNTPAPPQVADPAPAAFPADAPPFTFTFGAYRVGKLQVAKPIVVSTAYQIASIYADGLVTNDKPTDDQSSASKEQPPTLWAYLTVYQPGAYDSSAPAAPNRGNWANAQTIKWQYAPNAWAVITSKSTEANYPSKDELNQLAAGLRPAEPAVAKVPFTMSYKPAGYTLDEVGVHAMPGLNGIANARGGDYGSALFSKPALPLTGLTEPYGGIDGNDPPGSFAVYVVPAGNSNQHASPGVSCMNGFCNKWVAGGSVNVQVASGGRLTNAEMTRILNGITVGNVNDDSTWKPVTAAIR